MGVRSVFGSGQLTYAADGSVLDAWFFELRHGDTTAGTAAKITIPSAADELRRVRRAPVSLEVSLDAPPESTVDVWLRLHALSYRLVRPNEVNLDGIFSLLPLVAFTSYGAMVPEDFEARQLELRDRGVSLISLDKFGRMVDYVVPNRVRIADANRVRLGAYLAPGTTVMHEGFVNFNAGTLGACMVEGRISQGVVVGAGTDIGGGASIMGTLSGGGSEKIQIGERCLLGANSGLGISLGNDCVVEAGLYLTAGSPVKRYSDPQGRGSYTTVKARDLAGQDAMLFRRNAHTGTIEALPRGGAGIALNSALHA